ncbi:hypothetical protein K431DRAFT_336617 [Polychaeton citri CBS 116435]|uniref:Uncharacterized protein n=1 Tax=Polychaeton citri CBS 116435 TaxID=1314669 RepID=A0A9P4QF89_9PEZI|nr:hypothetical protein K431DRAFT_336617 [Polychaeton citri CBS 116435]
MVKRRRERDRPKARPDATYNPNKRVLLSYASDEDDNAPPPSPPAIPAPPAFGGPMPAIATPSTSSAIGGPHGVDSNRVDQGDENEHSNLDDDDDDDEREEEVNLRPRQHKKPSGHVMRDHTTGQMPALGSLAYQWDDEDGEEEYGSEQEEAMAYLRAVRAERQGIPEILHAQSTDMNEEEEAPYHDQADDTRGFYEDGSYVARPSLGPVLPPNMRQTLDPQEVYTGRLRDRFLAQRAHLRCSPTAHAIVALEDSRPTSMPSGNAKASEEWTRILQSMPPSPVQLQLMNQQSVVNLLDLIQQRLLRIGSPISGTLSIWIWSLLSRLEDVGVMTNDEVYHVREFGLQSLKVQLSLLDPEASAQLEQAISQHQAEGDPSRVNGGPNVNREDNRSAQINNEMYPDESNIKTADVQLSLATFDMILVVVGDCYGQRDLLEHRHPWKGPDDT